MASLFTNASAQTALQTLTAASKNLASTQTRVSTGYRINTAEDNAAYWSIATTLRSDVNALNAVQDALGLGAATVDVVYTGINDTKDLLDQVKSKLVTASQAGVPRAQVQAEITQLQNRLKDISKSTVINSESWLTQDSSAAGYNNNKEIVGSFTRSGGAISLDTITIDISKTKLYENSATAQSAVTATLNSSTAGTALRTYMDVFSGPTGINTATEAAWNTGITALGTARSVTAANITAAEGLTTGGKATAQGYLPAALADTTELDTAITTAFGVSASLALGAMSAEDKTELLTRLNGARTTAFTAIGAASAGADFTPAEAAVAQTALQTYNTTVTNTLMEAFTGGFQDAVAEAATKARQAYEASAKADVGNAQLGIFDKVRTVVSAADGSGAKAVRVSDIDISGLTDTDFDKGVLTSYLKVVDDALQELTLSASVIGAAKARVEGNRTFVKNLVDANNRGIGQLVDADLNEESTKLKALQVQEQLAIQALGIANSSTQNILSLFQ